MKRQVIAVSLLMIASSIQVANAASDGTINFSGGISSTTCTITVNGAAAGTTTVALPTISSTGMDTVGAIKGATALNFALTNCSATTGTTAGSAAIAFQGGDGIAGGNVLNRYTPVASAAMGVVLQIKNSNNEAVVIGNAPASSDYSPLASSGMTKSYTVQYLTTSIPVQAGSFAGAVTYSISYL
ncbi:fimbrial protein [Pseudomonas fildesensis]|uniref:fimbrial protein n=1 Tax=Pseudomonas fildesensis TaxID=1674920 RepID=UPI00137928A5|nr:fimbrial protein [Pseudomonas fildesensis]